MCEHRGRNAWQCDTTTALVEYLHLCTVHTFLLVFVDKLGHEVFDAVFEADVHGAELLLTLAQRQSVKYGLK